jgi:hypothetical protein
LRLRPGTNQVISINDSDFFVSQHYVDFLARFPDQAGMTYWVGIANQCTPTDAVCILNKRVGVSAAFYESLEFHDTGFYVYGFYKGTLGRLPDYTEFVPDHRQIPAAPSATLDAEKNAFALAFVQRPEFVTKYSSVLNSSGGYVDALIATVKATDGVDLSSQRSTLIALWDNTDTGRSKIARAVIENGSFQGAEFNPAFVLMQYFGYLKRTPDPPGYQFWLNVLNQADPNNFKGMVCSFITSVEYQVRFDATATHSNQECSTVH